MSDIIISFYYFLLLIFAVFFAVSLRDLWKKDLFFSILYFFLFYMPFSLLLIYLILPDQLVNWKQLIPGIFTVDREGWLGTYFYTFGSFFAFWVVVRRGLIRNKQIKLFAIREGTNVSSLFMLAVYLYTALIFYLFLSNFNYLNYWNYNNDEFRKSHVSFNLLCNLMLMSSVVLACFVALTLCSERNEKYNKFIYKFPFFFNVIFLFAYLIMTGDRSTIISLALGIFIPKFVFNKGRKGLMIKYLGLLFGLYICMQLVFQYSRSGNPFESFYELLFPTGMYANSVPMFAAVRLNFIKPFDAIWSIISKSIILTRSDYLYGLIAPHFTTVVWDGVNGFGYYLFSDGFILCGYLGILYNGLILGGLFLLWKRLTNSNDRGFNIITTSYLASHSLAFVRGMGTCYLIKYLYTDFLLCVVLYLLISGKKIVLLRRSRLR